MQLLQQPNATHPLLHMPLAQLQIVQSPEIVKVNWLDRASLEPTLAQNADGLWILTVRRQGEHSKFEVPFITSEVLLADAICGLVVVLIGYHGSETEKYGRLGYRTQKGQFYRYYQRQASGDWQAVSWRLLGDELRACILEAVQERAPAWARSPGKLQAERKPPTKPVTMTSYKVVRLINGRYFSLYDPSVEYVLGERMKQPAKPKHGGGFFSYPTIEQGTNYLETCMRRMPYHEEVETPLLALLECEVGGKIINYAGRKMASTYLRPMRVLEVRSVQLEEV